MSFWSKLGLADAAAVAGLREEILSLRQENEKLHEAQTKHAQQLCECGTDCIKNAAAEVGRRTIGLEDQLRTLPSELASSLWESQQEILSAGNADREHMMCQVSAILKNQESFQDSISSITRTRDTALAQIIEHLNAIRSIQDETSIKLYNICHAISGEMLSMKETAQAQNSTSETIVNQLDSGQIELRKILVDAQNIVEDMSFLKTYTESLWEAMKLVWINDLLDDSKRP